MFKKIKKQTQDMSDVFNKVLREYSESLLLAIVLAFFVRGFLLTAYRVPTDAMAPGILSGDFIFSNRLAYGLHIPLLDSKLFIKSPKRNDVVVFKCPLDENISCIKRVVAIGKDEVEMIEGQLHINGQKAEYLMDEKEVNNFSKINLFTEKLNNRSTKIKIHRSKDQISFKKLVVPEDSFFVLGDFRSQSEDSRNWGAIHVNKLQGRAFVIWFSLNWMEAESTSSVSEIRWHRVFKFIH
jgi:signal peptidase I